VQNAIPARFARRRHLASGAELLGKDAGPWGIMRRLHAGALAAWLESDDQPGGCHHDQPGVSSYWTLEFGR